MNQRNTIFPGLKNMTVAEVMVFTKTLTENGESTEQTLSTINCVDDLLSIQSASAMINARAGKVRHTRKKTKEVMEARILLLTE